MVNRDIGVGDRVAFSRAFLKSIGAITGWQPFARGVVVRIETLCDGCTLADIAWDDRRLVCGERGMERSRVNVKNLVRQSRIHLEV